MSTGNPNNSETIQGQYDMLRRDLRSCHEISSESAFFGSAIMIRTELTDISMTY